MDAPENDKNLSLGIRIYWIFGMDRGTALPLIIIMIIIITIILLLLFCNERPLYPFACRALSLSLDSKNVLFFSAESQKRFGSSLTEGLNGGVHLSVVG